MLGSNFIMACNEKEKCVCLQKSLEQHHRQPFNPPNIFQGWEESAGREIFSSASLRNI